MSSLSSSCSFHPQKFDVFLSYRGADTRKNFISFLYKELKAKEIRTFLDGEELERGCPISSQLDQAIKESKIAIIVFSATYSASVWCLQELVKILKREKEGLITVLPIFYGVDPCDVRRHIGEVKKQFKKHEKRESRETVNSWRDALTDLVNISGDCSKDREDDSNLFDKLKECISKILSSATPSNGNNLIGIDEHMNELYPRLDLNSNQDVQVIGISGTGSMGRSAHGRSRSPSSSLGSSHSQKFDVFLSFRGADTRTSFISFLYKELKTKQFRTFLDEEDLERGRLISSELIQAIEGSRIAVVVVSATYTASAWCLRELVKIVKRQKQGLLTVVPIFYGVDPCDVRRHMGEVEEHFKKHETRESIETVKSWRDALTYLANISGECSKDRKNDSKLVDKIMEYISKILSSTTPSNGNKLIGVEELMNELYPLLDLNSNQNVQVIGIWGEESMGRSALARHVYEKISHNFEAHCFLQDVRGVSLQCRQNYIQEELLSKMQGQGLSTNMYPNAIKARVRNKKVLLVANDVDKLEQLDALAEEYTLFGPGSRIIVATKDRQLLSSWNVKSVYEPEQLRCYDVCQPLRSEAFTQRDNHVGFKRSTYRPMKLSGINLFSTVNIHVNNYILN